MTPPCCAPRRRGSAIAPWPRPPLATGDVSRDTSADIPRDSLRAGMRVAGAEGDELVLRAYRPADGELVVETEPAA